MCLSYIFLTPNYYLLLKQYIVKYKPVQQLAQPHRLKLYLLTRKVQVQACLIFIPLVGPNHSVGGLHSWHSPPR